MTGEVSIRGGVKPVGGVMAKIEAARQAGVKMVIIPKENWQESFDQVKEIKIVPVEQLEEVIEYALEGGFKELPKKFKVPRVQVFGASQPI